MKKLFMIAMVPFILMANNTDDVVFKMDMEDNKYTLPRFNGIIMSISTDKNNILSKVISKITQDNNKVIYTPLNNNGVSVKEYYVNNTTYVIMYGKYKYKNKIFNTVYLDII